MSLSEIQRVPFPVRLTMAWICEPAAQQIHFRYSMTSPS